MKIYTKTGDKGTTQLVGGTRVPKHHLRIETYGTLDELLSYIGLLRDHTAQKAIKDDLMKIQNDLFVLGTFIALDPDKVFLKNGKKRLEIKDIDKNDIKWLEKRIDEMNQALPLLRYFVLPGGHPVVSFCHIARTVCRRAERRMTALFEMQAFDNNYLSYINRLSDYLFVLARKLSKDYGAEEIPWMPEK